MVVRADNLGDDGTLVRGSDWPEDFEFFVSLKAALARSIVETDLA